MEFKDLDLLSGITVCFFWGMFCLQHMFDQLINYFSGTRKVVISNSRWILKIPVPMLRSKQASLLAIFLKGTRPTCFLEQKHML